MSGAKSKRFLWTAPVLLLVLAAAVANATSMAPMSFEELTQRATAIVRVRCVSVESVWSAGEIWTDSRFVILEEAKADAFGEDQRISGATNTATAVASRTTGAAKEANSEGIVLRQLGGSIGGLHARVAGVPEFAPGEEAYLFLWRRAGERYRVLGWGQGTFRVARDARTGAARVTQDAAVTGFDGEARELQSRGVRSMGLAAFQRKLQEAIAAAR
jgi:hypothetical protein